MTSLTFILVETVDAVVSTIVTIMAASGGKVFGECWVSPSELDLPEFVA